MGLFAMACNNSSKKKSDIRYTVKETDQMSATVIMPDTAFYALGTEPFWSLYVIKNEKILFHPADGPDVEVPYVAPSTVNTNSIYNSSANGSSIEITITRKDCNNGMSEMIYKYEVSLQVNKIKYTGCGYDNLWN